VAELTPQERLQPSLLDRLIDDDPDSKTESRDRRVFNLRGLRASVLRDLGWLFNASGLAAGQDLGDHPLVSQTVLNFGLPDLAGKTASGLDLGELERLMAQAIKDFEPRILRDSVRVRARPAEDAADQNTLIFEIEGDLWAQPLPERLFVKTALDLEVGHMRVLESST
jgi:type VI secretion system protein ImpF